MAKHEFLSREPFDVSIDIIETCEDSGEVAEAMAHAGTVYSEVMCLGLYLCGHPDPSAAIDTLFEGLRISTQKSMVEHLKAFNNTKKDIH